VLTPGFWRAMQERHRAGEVVDIFPYRDNQRLHHGRPS
jgi:isocitrate dehydrogenase kinase/phosphatase